MITHSNSKYCAQASCRWCDGVVAHESWCCMANDNVRYAYECVKDASEMLEEDHIMLGAWGVRWENL